MKLSNYLMPTLKEEPREATTESHKLMLRSGMIRKVASGIYNLLPLGLKVLKKVENIVREEMNRSGAQEILMPMVVPSELWIESKRWYEYGPELLRIKDRHNREFCLGPTHEEVITDLIRNEIHSYKNLPLNIYQIQTKFRDEIRPRFGLMRAREFMMKDAYSFHENEKSLDEYYEKMFSTYSKIFSRCGLNFKPVLADSGNIGGNYTHEFHVLCDEGESLIYSCPKCGYAANQEMAECDITPENYEEELKPINKVNTPQVKSVEEVSKFLQVESKKLIKTIIAKIDGEFIAILIRGDLNLNETKIKNYFKVSNIEFATAFEITKITNGPMGFSGPVNLNIKKFADWSIQGMKNFVVGANESDYHFINANINRDFAIDHFVDFRQVTKTDKCKTCKVDLEETHGIEVGQIFKLGTKYSSIMKAVFSDKGGRERPLIMGTYGIGIGRTVQASIAQNHDGNGIIFPIPIAPFEVIILNLDTEDALCQEIAEKLYNELEEKKIEVLIDDRDTGTTRPGFKFKDADLIGIPIRINIGKKSISQGKIEIKKRNSKVVEFVDINQAMQKILDTRKELFI
jgi:prolyl-tRNA synthetase